MTDVPNSAIRWHAVLHERVSEATNVVGSLDVAEQLALLADAHPTGALERAKEAPAWLQERIELAYIGRQLIGEQVEREENARDKLAAFAVHVARRTVQPWGAWMRVPATNLHSRLSTLDQLMAMLLPTQ